MKEPCKNSIVKAGCDTAMSELIRVAMKLTDRGIGLPTSSGHGLAREQSTEMTKKPIKGASLMEHGNSNWLMTALSRRYADARV